MTAEGRRPKICASVRIYSHLIQGGSRAPRFEGCGLGARIERVNQGDDGDQKTEHKAADEKDAENQQGRGPSQVRDQAKSRDRCSKTHASLDPDLRILKPPQAEKAAELEREESQGRAAGQAGSLQGLSDLPDAAPESVDELLEEGNALEAGIVEGVEDAPDADQGEVRTHQVPEDDVPEEYLDNEP